MYLFPQTLRNAAAVCTTEMKTWTFRCAVVTFALESVDAQVKTYRSCRLAPPVARFLQTLRYVVANERRASAKMPSGVDKAAND